MSALNDDQLQELLAHLRNTLRYTIDEMEAARTLQILDEPLREVLASLRYDLEMLEAIIGEPEDLV